MYILCGVFPQSSVSEVRVKGIILAGGSGTRLAPTTAVVGKSLLPLYDKPTIYYSLSTLMLLEIRDILIISSERDLPMFEALLGDGAAFGISLSYQAQQAPNGIPEAFILGKKYIEGSNVALALGDNFFWGTGLANRLREARDNLDGAFIFIHPVSHPQSYGVVEFGGDGKIEAIHEKPKKPPSNFAVTGLYLYDSTVSELAETLTPSPRGELEITDLNTRYLEQGRLQATILGRGFSWLDTGNADDMLEAANFVATLERRQGLRIGSPEEIAWRQGWITTEELNHAGLKIKNSSYGQYLLLLCAEK